MAHQSADPSPERLGSYDVFPAFAHGGMASVHLGRKKGPKGFAKVFAIKRLNPIFAGSERHARMLIDEAKLTARIRSVHVVPVIEVVHDDGNLFIVMEFVHGLSLAALLSAVAERDERLPPPVAVAIMIDALRGLQAAHEATHHDGRPLEIIHRDVSPQNILVGVDGVTRVLDFGIARALGREQLTATGEIHGKVAYLAPEQLRGGRVTRAVDIYAAGLVTWEALVGERARAHVDPSALFAAANALPVAPSQHVATLPTALDRVVMKALSPDEGKRFKSAEAMASALESACVPASREDVAFAVERFADREIARLSELVTYAEAHSSEDVVRPRARGLHSYFWPLTALAGLSALGVLWATRNAHPDARASGSPATISTLTQTAPVTTAEVASSPSAPPAPVVQERRTTPRTTPARYPLKRPSVTSCEPPYELDAAGNKHFKPQCVP